MNLGQLNSPGLDHAENVLSTLIASDSAREVLNPNRCVVSYLFKQTLEVDGKESGKENVK